MASSGSHGQKEQEREEDVMSKKNICKDSLITFGLAVLTMMVAFALTKILPGQEKVIFPNDLYYQYAVFGRQYMEKLREGSNFFYSWNIGMGCNTALLFAFVAMSPLNFFYLIIDDIEIATLVILTLKPALAAAFFCAYARYNLRQESKLVIAVSLGYGLGSFYFAVMMMNSIAEGLYFLPLVMIFLKRFMDTGEKAGLTLIYTLSFLSYFYGGFIVGLSSLGYFCLCIFVHRQYTGRERMKILLRYAACVTAAVLLSACVLLPAAYYAVNLNSQAGENGLFGFVPTPLWDILPCFLPGRRYALDMPFPYLYCGTLTLLLLFLYFANRRIVKREKICVAVSMLVLIFSMMAEPVYLFLHMFNTPDGYTIRFAYVLSFVAASAAVRQMAFQQLPASDRTKSRTVVIFLAAALILYFITPVVDSKLKIGTQTGISYKTVGLVTLVVLLWIWLIFRYQKGQNGRGLIMLAILVTMIETSADGCYLMMDDGSFVREFYEVRHQTAENAIGRIKGEDEGIYRIDYPDKHNLNMQTAYDYYGIAYFSSAVNEASAHALDRLGYARGDFTVADSCQNEIMKMIFGTKYSVQAPWNMPKGEYEIKENPYSLPLGYMVRKEILTFAFTENVFDNQQRLLDCMAAGDVLCMEIYEGGVSLYPQNVNLIQTDSGVGVGGVESIIREDAYLKFTIPYREGIKPYAYFRSDLDRNLFYVPLIATTPEAELVRIEFARLSQPQTVPMVQEGGEYVVYLVFPVIFQDYGIFEHFILENVDFALFHEDGLSVCHEELAKAGMEIEVMEDGYVRGRVAASDEKPVLFTSFPCEEGWKAFVDGKEQEIVPLLEGGFIGLMLEPGVHEIEFRFTAPYSIQGKWLSLCGFVLWLVLIVWDLYDKKKIKGR